MANEALLKSLLGYTFEQLPKLVESFKKADMLDNPLFHVLDKHPEAKKAAETIRENAEHERGNIFGEAFRLIAERFGFTRIVGLVDIWNNVAPEFFPNIFKHPEEHHMFENEFEFMSAVTMLMPDWFKNNVPPFKEIRLLADNEAFLWTVSIVPLLGSEMVEKLKKDRKIDDVLYSLRIIHQELIMGTELGAKILKNLGSVGESILGAFGMK